MMEFPTLVYKCPGPHKGGINRFYNYIGVNDEKELQHRLSAGWFVNFEDALDNHYSDKIVPDEKKPSISFSRKQLEDKARKLGVKFRSDTPINVLMERVLKSSQE